MAGAFAVIRVIRLFARSLERVGGESRLTHIKVFERVACPEARLRGV